MGILKCRMHFYFLRRCDFICDCWQDIAEVRTAEGFPEDKKFGFWFNTNDLKFVEKDGSVFVGSDGWAEQYASDIKKYVGWYLTHVNETQVSCKSEVDAFKRKCQPGTPITFRFASRKPIAVFIHNKCLRKSKKIFEKLKCCKKETVG